MNIRVGYMPDIDEDLTECLEFVRKNFDFLELTIFPGQENKILGKPIKRKLNNFTVFGHIHWNNNLVNCLFEDNFSRIFQEIDIFNKLKAEYITIHPSVSDELKEKEIIETNKRAVSVITDYSDKILIENSSRGIFSDINNIKKILNDNVLGITLDTGHAILSGNDIEYFFKKAESMIKHFHIHGVLDGKDHSMFKKKSEFLEIINKISKVGDNFPFILEIFQKENGRNFSSIHERRKCILSYIKEIKKRSK